jgi:hypothetical protein
MTELPKCPDCGAPMNVEIHREIGRQIHKEEISMAYANARMAGDEAAWKEYVALPAIVGRMPNSPWFKTETCTVCQYVAHDGKWSRRGPAEGQ